MSTNHTPGPWATIGQHEVVVCAKLDGFVAPICSAVEVGGRRTHEEAKANARLIAAAPELFAALKDLLNYENLGAYDRADVRKQARAAIAKAGGTQ